MVKSDIGGFHALPVDRRAKEVASQCSLSQDDADLLTSGGTGLRQDFDHMVENVIGMVKLPFSVATNFRVNGKDYFIPMVTEESSVVAACSNGAKLARLSCGGFTASAGPSVMCAEIVLVGSAEWNASDAVAKIMDAESVIIAHGHAARPSLVARGCGVRGITATILETRRGNMVKVIVSVDVGDCMGANTVTTIAEAVAPYLEELTGASARLKIVTNLCEERTAKAWAEWTPEVLEASVKGSGLSGAEVIEAMLDADAIAEVDPHRAATANKGVMNGVCALSTALVADTRAMESAAHSFAATRTGSYTSLTRYEKTPEGNLKGTIEIPVPLGTVGGAAVHPTAQLALRILRLGASRRGTAGARSEAEASGDAPCPSALAAPPPEPCESAERTPEAPAPASEAAVDCETAEAEPTMVTGDVEDAARDSGELACVVAAVGLAQNFAAMRALVTRGLQEGHMRLHATNIAMMAGARGPLVKQVAGRIIELGSITVASARDVLAELMRGVPCAIS